MKKAFWINNGTYPDGVVCLVGLNKKECEKYINKHCGKLNIPLDTDDLSDLGELDGLNAKYYRMDNGWSIVYIPEFKWTPRHISLMTHEMLHATYGVLNYFGIEEINEENEEAWAYQLTYYVRGFLGAMKDKKTDFK